MPASISESLAAPRPRVFIIDDDASVRRSLARLLESAGYAATAFANARDFLRHAPAEGPACAIVDLHMPDLNGLQLQALLGERPEAVPLVFITGNGDVPSSVRAMKSGAVDFLLKPFDAAELLQAVESALARSRRAQRARAEMAGFDRKLQTLTARERQVLELVLAGQLNKQIGATLGIAEHTVKIHRGAAIRKMGGGPVAALARAFERIREST